MNTEPDDDLDITAELPQLNLQEAHARYAVSGVDAPNPGHEGVTESDSDLSKTGAWLATDVMQSISHSGEDWPLVDELLTVRDRIVDLEAELLDAQHRLTKLDSQHKELQARHVELSVHSTEITRDHERIDAERALLLESRQQLTQQLESFQIDAAASVAALQQQLDQLQQQLAAERAQHADYRELRLAESAQHQSALRQLSANLSTEQERVGSLESSLQAATRAHADQEAAAAVLARNLSHELLEKQAVQSVLALREQRMHALELTQQQLTVQLADAGDRYDEALVTAAALQEKLQTEKLQNIDLQQSLKLAEERIGQLGEQLKAEYDNLRSAELDNARLTELANTTRDSYEGTREQLSARLSEINVLQQTVVDSEAKLSVLEARLAERQLELRQRDDLLVTNQQALKHAEEIQAASALRESTLTDTLNLLREELLESHSALHARDKSLQEVEQRQAEEHQASQQAQAQLEATQQQMHLLETQLRQRDQFILDQAAELEQLQHAVAESESQSERAETLHQEQRMQALTVSAELASLQAEHDQHLLQLSQAQQELAERRLEQGASAKQVEALQQELHQHVDALNAIRRDIHQVAQQSRYREPDVLVRTLVRTDDPAVVHLLNKPAMVLGRSYDADICIKTDSISRRHACLRVARDVVIIEDLGSTNGCYVNGKRVKKQLLKDGDQLSVGDVKFRFSARVSQG
ncbi:MAG: FHA domain-containing protein [Steroidobacteraceae bacterium]